MGKYGRSSDDAMRQERVGGGSEFWTPPDGDSRIRIMPPATEEEENFWFKTATHFHVGPDEVPVPCPAASGVSDRCFLCRIVKRLSKGDDDEQADAKEMDARLRYLISIVDYAEPEAGVRPWPCPITVMRLLRKFRLNEDEYGDMTDLLDGYDILISKTGTNINTKYDATPARKNTRFPTKEMLENNSEAVAEMYRALKAEELELPDLAAVQSFVDDEEMERVYRGTSGGQTKRTESSSDDEPDDEPDDESEEETQRRRRSSASTSRQSPKDEETAEEGEDDGGSDDNPSDDEPEPEPRGRRSTRRSSRDVDPDVPADDEPEPEPAPERKKRGSKRSESSSDQPEEGRSRLRGRVRDLS